MITSAATSSAHRFLHERADPCLVGGGQLLQREGDRPHGAFIAARSSSVNPLTALPVTVALLADFCVSVFGLIEPPHTTFGWTPGRRAKCGSALFKPSGTCVESYHRVLPNGSRLSCSGRRGAPPPCARPP